MSRRRVLLPAPLGPMMPRISPRRTSNDRSLTAHRSRLYCFVASRHKSIAALNAAWRTDYGSFDEVGEPADDSPGWVDCRRFGRERFAAFYGYLFDRGLRPALGEKLYGNKTSLDPFLHRACRWATMTCWDDLVAAYPLWKIRCAADTTGKPLFNSELHLYNDEYAYGPSAERSRYRYFTSALLGEYLTASFAWGMWKKPEIAAIHGATAGGIYPDLIGATRAMGARPVRRYDPRDDARRVYDSLYGIYRELHAALSRPEGAIKRLRRLRRTAPREPSPTGVQ